MSQKISTFVIALLAIIIGLYPGIYFFNERNFGLLSSKSNELLSSSVWNAAFYTHIIFGGIALLIGWLQFSKKLRLKNLSLHRTIGKFYIISALISAIASIELGFFASGGFIASSGFICLGITWFTTTLFAYLKIRNMQIEQHRRLMIYSYAACFAAVTLRIWLPILNMIFSDFTVAYSIVAWLCWVPNLLLAVLIASKEAPGQTEISTASAFHESSGGDQ